MKLTTFVHNSAIGAALTGALLAMNIGTATAQGTEKFIITKMAEKKVAALPEGELYWHVRLFGTLEEAQADATDTSLIGEFDGGVWLFTLGNRDPSAAGGKQMAKIGPVARIDAQEYILRINNAIAPAGAKSSIHSHPGTEAFFVLSGQLTQHTPFGRHVVNGGGTLPGVPDQTMQVESTGDEDLQQLIMFVVDASRPFSEKKDHLQ